MTASSENYRTLASQLAFGLTQLTLLPWRVLNIDLRHHGGSGGAGPPPGGWPDADSVSAAAGDVLRLLECGFGGARPDVLLGHSFGAKVGRWGVEGLAS